MPILLIHDYIGTDGVCNFERNNNIKYGNKMKDKLGTSGQFTKSLIEFKMLSHGLKKTFWDRRERDRV